MRVMGKKGKSNGKKGGGVRGWKMEEEIDEWDMVDERNEGRYRKRSLGRRWKKRWRTGMGIGMEERN